jgi:hypothetical protein
MASVDDIEAFIAEVDAALDGGRDDRFVEMLRALYRSHDPKVIEVCDAACADLQGRQEEARIMSRRGGFGSDGEWSWTLLT